MKPARPIFDIPEARGMPTAYRDTFPEYAYKFTLLGMTQKEMADIFKVTDETIREWRKVYPEFDNAIAEGKDITDARVAHRLYERAMGYDYEEKVVKEHPDGSQTIETHYRHCPPDVKSINIWLANRQKGRWSLTPERIEVTGKDGGNIQIEAVRSKVENLLETIAQRQIDKSYDTDTDTDIDDTNNGNICKDKV